MYMYTDETLLYSRSLMRIIHWSHFFEIKVWNNFSSAQYLFPKWFDLFVFFFIFILSWNYLKHSSVMKTTIIMMNMVKKWKQEKHINMFQQYIYIHMSKKLYFTICQITIIWCVFKLNCSYTRSISSFQ